MGSVSVSLFPTLDNRAENARVMTMTDYGHSTYAEITKLMSTGW